MNKKILLTLSLSAAVLVVAIVGVCVRRPATVVFETVGEEGNAAIFTEEGTYFDNARYTRKLSRDETVAALKGILNSSSADAESRKNASAEIVAQTTRAQMETAIEGRVMAKGFEDCVAFVSEKTVSVVVKTDGLSREQSAQIFDIIIGETEYSANVIKIIEIK